MDWTLYCLDKQLFTDVQIVDEEGQTFAAHAIILSAQEYFYTALTTKIGKKKPIYVKNINTAKLLIRYIYGGEIDITHIPIRQIIDMLHTASIWMIKLSSISGPLALKISDKNLTNDEIETIALYGENVLIKSDIGFIIGCHYYDKPLAEINRELVYRYGEHLGNLAKPILGLRLKLPELLKNYMSSDILMALQRNQHLLHLDGFDLPKYLIDVIKGKDSPFVKKAIHIESFVPLNIHMD